MTDGLIPNCYREPERFPVKERFDKNEVIRPAIAGWYLIMAVVFLVCSLSFVIMPVSAMTITLSNPGGMEERDVAVYYPNSSTGQMDMLGLYNTTSVITLEDNTSYIFALKPQSTNFLTDPGDWLVNSAFPFLQTNVIALVVSFALIGLFFARWK